ncbi:GDP-fucose protein O-fucosyltransferase 2-like isoform X2 [Mytilus trossulus]|uniref:GDP-fucose protein O-fucosyltransferase 2-like isoform X2 n=1 Tax=Mytilus trossulus TaxID=6551 RepID=UPI00300546C2
MHINAQFCIVLLNIFILASQAHEKVDIFKPETHSHVEFGEAKSVRYLLYDVNPGEGFNLRRDVFMRVANLVKLLNEDEPWVLVLPPWGRLYHWKSQDLNQIKVRWSTFFDLASLREHIPVIEFEDYLTVMGEEVVDEIYYLQRYKEGWTNGKWEEKMDIRECIDRVPYQKDENGKWRGWFFGYENVYAKKFACLSVQSEAGNMKSFLMKNTTSRSVMLERAEQVIHGQYSEFSSMFWIARRSMVFAKHLRDIGDEFRKEYLDSTDENDKTILSKWPEMKKNHGDAKGGPYLSVHLRRKDYLYAHKEQVPSLKYAAKQIKELLKKNKLKKVFIASDCDENDFETLKGFFKKAEIYRYKPTQEIREKYKDGGVAIIDQWIAAHARHFVGTYVSTFSFRIQEEREILGFDPETTFNRLCSESEEECEQPSKWKIVY